MQLARWCRGGHLASLSVPMLTGMGLAAVTLGVMGFVLIAGSFLVGGRHATAVNGVGWILAGAGFGSITFVEPDGFSGFDHVMFPVLGILAFGLGLALLSLARKGPLLVLNQPGPLRRWLQRRRTGR